MKNHKISAKLLSVIMALALTVSIIPAADALFGSKDTEEAMKNIVCNSAAGSTIKFDDSIFTAALSKGMKLEGIVITELPSASAGVLKYGDRDLLSGEAVTMTGITGLRFIPGTTDEVSAVFSFLPVFESGSGSENVTVSINLSNKPNSPPVAENLELATYKNISVTGSFKAIDADGDMLSFKLVKKPARGEIIISDDGNSFVYKPFQNKTGTDSFTYAAIDNKGNVSADAKVSIKIEKQSTALTYADMTDNPSYYAAIKLAEEGIFTGEKLGGSYFFQPNKIITRGEFLAMAVTCMNLDSSPVSKTGFADDESTPTWVMPYVSTALKSGIITGIDNKEGQKVFRSDNPLSRAEAAVIVNNALKIADSGSEPVFADDDAVPTWARQSAVNLESVGVISSYSDGSLRLSEPMTRAGAAEILYSAIKVMDQRKTKTGLLGWVW